MTLSRRGFLGGAALVGLAAPAVITTPGLLMRARSLFVPKITVATQSALTEAEIEAVVNGLLSPSMIGRDVAKIFARCLVDGGAAKVYLNDDTVAAEYVRPQELYL